MALHLESSFPSNHLRNWVNLLTSGAWRTSFAVLHGLVGESERVAMTKWDPVCWIVTKLCTFRALFLLSPQTEGGSFVAARILLRAAIRIDRPLVQGRILYHFSRHTMEQLDNLTREIGSAKQVSRSLRQIRWARSQCVREVSTSAALMFQVELRSLLLRQLAEVRIGLARQLYAVQGDLAPRA
jgi:hypothetical protein